MSNVRSKAPLLASMLWLATACSDAPTVEVSTHVGPAHALHDADRQAANAKAVLTALLPEPTAAPADEEPAAQLAAHAPTTSEELDGLVQAIRRGPLSDIAGPAHRIAAAGPAVWPEVARRLSNERPAPRGDVRSLLQAIGGDVPNRYGHFALRWKKDHGHKVTLSEDWFADLLALPRGRVSARLHGVYRDTLVHTALLRAAANAAVADTELAPHVVSTLLDEAFVDNGLFRDEVSRAIASIGDPAIPSLVVAAVVPPHTKRHELETFVMRPRFAEAMLDRMDRLHPTRAIEAATSDPHLLARVLAAYGLARRGEAASEVLRFVDAPAPSIRAAARVAWLSYVVGPPPRVAGRTIKLLGGGTGHAQAFLTYRERARVALLGRLATEAPDLLEPPCEERRENGTIDAHCEAQLARLTDAWFQRIDATRVQAQAEALEAALSAENPAEGVTRIDQLLAQGRAIAEPRRVAAFLERVGGEAAEGGDPARAAQLWRKAAVVSAEHDAELARRLHVQALLAEASVEGLGPHGRAMLLRTAAELDPEDVRIQGALQAVRRRSAAATGATDPHVLRGVGLVALALVCLSVLGAGLRRRVQPGSHA